ncbi:hypothetical protein Taro_027190 [Colocasia esculenta]|uniref:Uncharacterized protein n=1 Tax=Colocasia esculenta TaxID=4460 RepID=A0A843VDX4_COLES|nr:hypothetical protein [Colocasia esculenta]
MLCVVKVSAALAPVALEERVVHVVDMVFTWFMRCAREWCRHSLSVCRHSLLVVSTQSASGVDNVCMFT